MTALTATNCMRLMEEDLKDRKPTLETMMKLSFYLDFAISTGLIPLIDAVHDRTDKFYLDNFKEKRTTERK